MKYVQSNMPKIRAKLDIKNEKEAVYQSFKEESGWKRERLLSVKMSLEGKTNKDIALELGRSRQTISDWFDKYREGGIKELLMKRRGKGAKMRLSDEIRNSLIAELEAGIHRTAGQIWDALEAKHDMSDYKPSSIYYLMGKCEASLKAPRPSNPKKDPVKEQEFRETLADKMEDLCLPKDRPVRLWIYDEMRYGLLPLTRKVWCVKGVRPTAPSKRVYENGYLYGALQVGGGGAEFYQTNRLDQEWDIHFMEQISQRDLYASHVVIGDGAGFHLRDNNPNLPDNVFILHLPPYCPELNPVEKLWDIVKDGICNRSWESLKQLEDKITDNIRPYWEDARKVYSLFTNSYLPSELNDSCKINKSSLIV